MDFPMDSPPSHEDTSEHINTTTIDTTKSNRFDTIRLKSLSLPDVDEYCETLSSLKETTNLDEFAIIINSLVRSDQITLLNELNYAEQTQN